MYTPKHFQNTDTAAIRDFIRQNSFGILVSQTQDKLWATHIPLELLEDNTKLSGHVSRANPQWKNFTNNKEVLAIFQGPHTYISSSWYDHENVPTWNYIAVHVYGTITIIEGEQLYHSLKQLTDKYERHVEKPVSLEKMSPDYVKKQMHGIIGFEINITSTEATYKLSQNRDKKNHQAIIGELEKRKDQNALQIAAAMKKNEFPNK